MATTAFQEDEVQFTVTYDGPAVQAGRMDARDLAPAMLATAKLFEHTGQLMLGSTAQLKIEVNADFKRGSFSYDLVTRAVELKNTLLANASVSDIISVGTMLFLAVKHARGRRPKEVDRTGPEPRIVFHEGDSLTVNVHVANLFFNPTIRKDLDGAVEPLKREGIDVFRLDPPSAPPTIVQKEEVDYFRPPVVDEEVLQDTVIEDIVQVLSPDFRPGNKWQFQQAGGGHFWAAIIDEEFLGRVARHEVAFGAGDALRVRMRVRVTRSPTGDFDRFREILKVVKIIPPGPEPLSLFDAIPPDA